MPVSNETSNAATIDEAREIVATRVFDAPRELVFSMWTDPEHLEHWWGPRGFRNTIQDIDVRPGGAWTFIMHGPDGTDYQNKIVYREIVKPERITYSHVSGPLFESTVTFEEEGRDKTRITVRMVFESASLRDKVAEEFGAVEGLSETLERLGEELANLNPFTISREFDAPRDLMFKVWTEADHLKHWFSPRELVTFHCTNDLRRGGMMHYGMRAPDGGEVWGRWIYREIVPPERLVFVVSFSDPKGGVTVHPSAPDWPREILSTVTFEEHGGKTRVTVLWAPINATEIERTTFEDGRDSMKGGWTGTLDQLEDYLAKV